MLVYDLVKKDKEIKKLGMSVAKISELKQKLIDRDRKISSVRIDDKK